MASRRRRGRALDGILLLDKPQGLSSNQALQRVKALYQAAKAGHTGSLDPLATGVLPLCFGEATKFSQYLLDADKVYDSTFVLGAHSSTGDAEGELTWGGDPSMLRALDQASIERAMCAFRGAIEQRPPMYSALKRNGQPLYALARRGIEVEREPRAVHIYAFELLALRHVAAEGAGDAVPQAVVQTHNITACATEEPAPAAAQSALQIDVRVHCSKGTYIRSLAEDLGAALGCGAYVGSLRRTRAGPFAIEQCIGLPVLQALAEAGEHTAMQQRLLPAEQALMQLPQVALSESAGFYLRQGQPVLVPNAPCDGMVRVALESGEFLGVGEILGDGRVAPRRLMVTGR